MSDDVTREKRREAKRAWRRAPKRAREEWVALVNEHASRGMNGSQIARAVGLSGSYVRALLTDPTGELERRRKDRYRGRCEICDAPTDGSNGRAKAPRFCSECVHDQNARRTPDALIAAIQDWARRFGRPPTATEWNPAFGKSYAQQHPGQPYAEHLLAMGRIVLDEDWPRSPTVIGRFGTFRAALEAAGFDAPAPGRHRAANSQPSTDAP